jgi:hypothetical protein
VDRRSPGREAGERRVGARSRIRRETPVRQQVDNREAHP